MCGEAGLRCPSARWHTGSYATSSTCRVPAASPSMEQLAAQVDLA